MFPILLFVFVVIPVIYILLELLYMRILSYTYIYIIYEFCANRLDQGIETYGNMLHTKPWHTYLSSMRSSFAGYLKIAF